MRLCLISLLAVLLSLAACETEDSGTTGGPDVLQPGSVSGTVTLQAEEGFAFYGQQLLTGDDANIRNVDLVAYPKGSEVSLQVGEPDGAMRVFRRAYPGPAARVDTLAELDAMDPPSDGDHDVLLGPEIGNAAVLRGNVSPGWARFRVIAPPDPAPLFPSVTIEYEAWWP